MRISLERFKQHESLELDLPDQGMVQLAGPSGVGKTTIMEAFLEACEGESDRPIMRGKSSCRVELDLPTVELNIVRRRGPHSLNVMHADVSYEGDVAQEMIRKVLGYSSLVEFFANSYVIQGHGGSLLSMQPADQQRLIQQLSCGDSDPEKFRDETTAIVSERAVDLKAKTAKSDAASGMLIRLEANTPLEPAPPTDIKVDQRQISDELVDLTGEIADRLTQKRLLETELVDPARQLDVLLVKETANLTANDEQVLEAVIGVEVGNQRVRERKGDVDVMIANAELPATETAAKELIWKKQQRFSGLVAMKEMAARVAALLPASVGRMLPAIEEHLGSLSARLEAVAADVAEINETIGATELAMHTQPCPACTAPLIIQKNVIVSAKSGIAPADADKIISKLTADKKEKISQIADIESEIKKFTKLANDAAHMKKYLPEDVLPGIKTQSALNDLETDVINKWAMLNMAIAGEKAGVANLAVIQERGRKISAKIQQLEALKKDANFRPEAAVRGDLDALATELEKLNTAKAAGQIKLSVAVSYQTELSRYFDQKNNFDKYNKALAEAQAEFTLAATAREEAAAELAAAERLKWLADFAATSAIEGKVDEINARAKQWIDRMFDGDGTAIVMTHQSQTKKGDVRAKTGVDIFHKGYPVDKVKEFSGGEKSRAFLAFQMALSGMYPVPFLLIDEGLAGVDPELKATCLEVLKEAATDKLVLVIEHGAPESVFDKVVNV